MKKKLKTLVICLLIMGMLSIPVNADEVILEIAETKTIDNPNVEAYTNGMEVEYYMDYKKQIFFDLPTIIKIPTINENGTRKLKYYLNSISNADSINVEHAIVNHGAYLELDNVIRETEYNHFRLLIVRGETSIYVEPSTYAQDFRLDRYNKFRFEDGRLLFLNAFDPVTYALYSEGMVRKFTGEPFKIDIKEHGLYHVSFGPKLSGNLVLNIYVAGEDEDVTYIPPKEGKAIKSTTKIQVNDKDYEVPAYNINDENYLRIRDIAYILNGTSKQFDVLYHPNSGKVSLVIVDYEDTEEKENSYEPIGTELQELPDEDKIAILSSQRFLLQTREILPLAYNIDESDFVRLRDIGKILDFEVSLDSLTKKIIINTDNGYVYE